MILESLKEKLKNNPETVEFDEVIALIESNYTYTPYAFDNGRGEDLVKNEAGKNVGSCKIFAFADEQNMTEEETLHLFGRYYRKDVLGNPDGNDHQNIRTFMKYGWSGITFFGPVLIKK